MSDLDLIRQACELFSRAEEAFFEDFFPEDRTDEELARLWLVAAEVEPELVW